VTTVTSTTKLVCPECRHENEPERIYCHECGARLDRSAVTVSNTAESVEATRRRVRKLFDPQGLKIRAFFFKTCKLFLLAGVVAMIVQMILPPDVPPPVKSELVASQIRFDLESAATRRRPPQLQYTQEQVNVFLTYALKAKRSSLNKPLLDFKRAFVEFGENTCAVTVERSLFGYSLYTRSIYEPVLKAGKIEAASKSASIGRLALHPRLAPFIGILFSDLWSALNQEIKLVSKMGSIEFHNKTVVLMSQAK
jgi:hypothetical protein